MEAASLLHALLRAGGQYLPDPAVEGKRALSETLRGRQSAPWPRDPLQAISRQA